MISSKSNKYNMEKKKTILDKLFEDYYINESKSRETSSFWKNLGQSQIVKKKMANLKLADMDLEILLKKVL